MKWAKLLKCQDSQHYFIASPDNESFYTGGGATRIKPLKCRELPTFFRCVIRQHVIFKHSRSRVTRRFFCLCVNDMLTRIVTWVPSIANYANKKLLLGAISFSFWNVVYLYYRQEVEILKIVNTRWKSRPHKQLGLLQDYLLVTSLLFSSFYMV